MKTINPLQFPVLKTERMILRQLIDDDAQDICDLRNDEDVNRYIDRPKDCNIEKALDFIARMNDNSKQNKGYYWAICLKDNTKLIGTACMWNFTDDKSVEIGYELCPNHQGLGLMNEVLQRMLDFSFNVLGLKKLEAFVHKDNERSINLLVKNKFVWDMEHKGEGNPDFYVFTLSN